MLRKLMKHEFRATARIMGPLYLVLLLTAVGANVSTRGLIGTDNRLLSLLGALLVTAFSFAIIGVCVMSLVLMIQRFHKNLLGDEGYVMFTLPASVHQHVWSKLIVSSVWFIATGVAVVLAFLVMAYDVGFLGEFFLIVPELFSELNAYYALNGSAVLAEFLALMFLGCCAACLQFYAAMAVGYGFSNHKGLLSVVFFFVFQFAVQLLGSVLIIGLDGLNLHWAWHLSDMQAVHLMMGILILGTVLYGAIFYVVTTIALKKRLNLE